MRNSCSFSKRVTPLNAAELPGHFGMTFVQNGSVLLSRIFGLNALCTCCMSDHLLVVVLNSANFADLVDTLLFRSEFFSEVVLRLSI